MQSIINGGHQFIKIYDLCTDQKYNYKTNFPRQAETIARLFDPVIDQLPSTYFDQQNLHHRVWNQGFIADLLLKHDPSWSINSISRGRTKFASHPSLPDVAFKTFETPPGRGQPLANTFRVPMAHILDAVVKQRKLEEDIIIPTKGLIPLASTDVLLKLNENTLNEAFVVAVQKMELLPHDSIFSRIKQLPESAQRRKAEHLCILPIETGIGDWQWDNLQMTFDSRIVAIDTEPLYGELMPAPIGDDFETKFPRTASWLKPDQAGMFTLQHCALQALKTFRDSSVYYELHIFEETAQRHIDKLS